MVLMKKFHEITVLQNVYHTYTIPLILTVI